MSTIVGALLKKAVPWNEETKYKDLANSFENGSLNLEKNTENVDYGQERTCRGAVK